MPDMSELLASYFGGGATDKPKKKAAKPLRRWWFRTYQIYMVIISEFDLCVSVA